ncbi:BHLH domain-containing protein [Abeliophyllum distichum]|uniref:BHLH domain-containing protein n=1 Tax=Abeliophyllum distichum TaxID=126358 RepID=A0ABD1QEK4_9LAMI
MDREFQLRTQPLFSGGEVYSTTEIAVDEAFINGVYAGLSFHSLLKQEQTPPPLLFMEPSLCYDPDGFFVQGFPATETQNLKMPKTEQQLFNVNSVSGEFPQYNFFSKTTQSVAESDVIYPRLPGLLSLELPQYNHFQLGAESSSSKNPVEPAATATDSERRSYHQHRFGPYRSPEAVAPSSTMARLRRQRISDKTRCLQKLLPWDKRMDMATMLEETYKYIKFLQAQISVLQSMPRTAGNDENDGAYGGELGRLNRQQLLEVVVNSPVAQTVLCSKGFCVYSVEQFVMLKNNAERNSFFHHMNAI